MCGIIGYVGSADCTAILLDGLSKLEYRGYDSAGVAVITPPGLEDFFAAVGRPRQGGEPAPVSFGRPENVQELVDAAHFARPEALAEISPK